MFTLLASVVNETLDSILDESGDEEEQEAVVNQVLDEIGIEISGKVREADILREMELFHPENSNLMNRYYYRCFLFQP